MLDELLAVYRTHDYGDHGWTRLLRVDAAGEGFGMELLVESELEGVAGQRWAVRCAAVLDYQLLRFDAYADEHLRLSAPPHPLLAPYTEVHEQLFFGRAPADPVRAAFALWKAHRALADGYAGVAPLPERGLALDRFLAVGYGKFADGPASWMRAYARVLEEHGMVPSLLEVRHTRADRRHDMRALTLGGSFVVGGGFDALLLDPG